MLRSIVLSLCVAATCAYSQVGPFGYATQIPLPGVTPGPFTVADFNGDSRPDVAVLDAATCGVSVLLGNATYGFVPAPGSQLAAISSTCQSEILAAGDFNGDGSVDLVAAYYDGVGRSLAVWPGLGDGTFGQPVVTAITPLLPSRLASADVNGDGKLDLVADYLTSGVISSGVIFYGDGAGGFGPPPTINSQTFGGTAFADFNHDGKMDFVTGALNVLLSNQAGTYTSTIYGAFFGGVRELVVGDYDHDGAQDVIERGVFGSSSTPALAGWRGDGSGGFFQDFYYTFTSTPADLVVGDFDGDGVLDWAVSTGSNIEIGLLKLPASSVTPARYTYPGLTGSLRAVDVSGDGRPDLLVFAADGLHIFSTSPVASPSQTITFPALADIPIDAVPFIPAATASSGLPVTLSSETPSICTVSANVVTPVVKGTCILVATQPGNGSVGPALPAYRSVTVTGRTQTVTVSTISGPVPLGTPPITVQASASSGLPVSVGISSGSKCTASGLTIMLTAVGTCTYNAYQKGDEVYNSAYTSYIQFQITGDAQPQTITFPAIQDQGMSPFSFPISPAASSGLALQVVSNTPSTCGLYPDYPYWAIVTFSLGTCSITASQAGSSAYLPASATRTFNITQGTQTITISPIPDTSLAAGSVNLPSMSSVRLTIAYTSNAPGVCSVSGDTVTLLASGTCTVTGTQAGNQLYSAAQPVTASFTVVNGPTKTHTLVFPPVADYALGTAPFAITASTNASAPITFSSDTPAVCSASSTSNTTGQVTLLALGTCSVTATIPGDGVYFSMQVTRVFAVTQGTASQSQSIQTGMVGNEFLYLGELPFSASVFATSGLPVTLTSQTPDMCSVSGSIVTPLGSGQCALLATQPGNAVYQAAAPLTISRSFSTQQTQTVSPYMPSGQNVGAPPLYLAVTSSAPGLPVYVNSATPAVCAYSGTSVTLIAAGQCTLVLSQPGNDQYSPAPPGVVTFSIGGPADPQPQTITFPQPGTYLMGSNNSGYLTATASSGLTVSFISQTPSVCTTFAVLAPGQCTFTASQSGSAGYLPAESVTRSFTVLPAQPQLQWQNIAVSTLGDVTVGVPPFAAIVSTSSGLPVTLVSSTPAQCTTSGIAITVVAAGRCTITALQDGDATYAPASPVTRTFNISPSIAPLQPQTITFDPLPERFTNMGSFAIMATASSGLPVQFSTSEPYSCSVSGNVVTLGEAGYCTITASQAGDSTYAPARPVTRSFYLLSPNARLLWQPLVFAALPDGKIGDTVALSASASTGLPVAFLSNTPSVCTLSGSTVTLVATGSCSITASVAGDGIFAAATPETRTFTVGPAQAQSQTIAFGLLGTATKGAEPFTISASASSGLPVTFVSMTPWVCTVSGSTVTLVSAGLCSVTASQVGNGSYLAAALVSRDFVVIPALLKPQTITFGPIPPRTLADGPFTVAATASSGLTVTFSPYSGPVCGVSGSTVTLVAVGQCSITASQQGDETYAPAPLVTQSFTVSSAPGLLPQTILFQSYGSTQVGTPPIDLFVGSSSGLSVVLTSNSLSVCTLSGHTLTVLMVGQCSITASQPGNGTYAPADPVTRTITVTVANQAITFGALPGRALSDPPFTVSATASSGLVVAFTSGTPAVCTVSGFTVMLVAAGQCTITASQAGNTNYAPAVSVTQFFTVSPAGQLLTQTISFEALPARAVGDPPFTVFALASSGLPVTFTSDTPLVCIVTGATVTPTAVGQCAITASQPGNATYAAAPTVTQPFPITSHGQQAPQTITFGALPGRALGTPPFAITATATSGLTVIFTSNSPSVCTVVGSTVTLVAVGRCSIQASQSGDTIYAAAALATQVFSVSPAGQALSQAITFNALPGRALGTPPFTISATASSGLTVEFTSVSPTVCSVYGSTVVPADAGQCWIQASQAGNGTYAMASPVTQSFTVSPAGQPVSQTITFASLIGHSLGDVPFTLSAIATSGLAVTFTSTTPAVCTTSGAVLTLLAIGDCSITATQPGDASHLAADPATQSFRVPPQQPSTGPNIFAVMNASGYIVGRSAPLCYVTISGARLLPAPLVKLRDSLGAEFPVNQLSADDIQINIVIPDATPLGEWALIVTNASGEAAFPVTVANDSGTGPAAVSGHVRAGSFCPPPPRPSRLP